MPGKQARVLCPVCQEPIPPDETECENCGAFVIDEAVVRLSRAFGLDREKALKLFEAGFRHPKQLGNRDPNRVLEKGEVGLLFICTNCGGFVAGGDSKCPRCAAEFESEPEASGAEEDILDLVLCPICGADNDPEIAECEVCGEPLKESGTPPPEPPSEVAESHALNVASTEEALGKVIDFLEDAEPRPPQTKPPAIVPPPPPSRPTVPRLAPPAIVPPAPPSKPVVARPRPIVSLASPPAPIPRPPPPPAPPPVPVVPKPVPEVRLPVQAKRKPEAIPPPPVAASRPTEPARTTSSPSVLRPRRVPTYGMRSVRPRQIRNAGRATRVPAELAGGLVLAAGASLVLAGLLEQPDVALGIAAVLVGLGGVELADVVRFEPRGLSVLDCTVLAVGILLGVSVPLLAASPDATTTGIALASASAASLGWATIRLRQGPQRVLLVLAGAVPLAATGVIGATNAAFTGTLPWALGILMSALWPGAVIADEIRRRRSTSILHREIARAERDIVQKNYDRSLAGYDRAIAAARSGVRGADIPWYGKGATLILLGRYEEALRAIDTALDINPRNEVAWVNKGNALTKMGRLIDALRCFNAAIKVNPGYEVAWNNKGNALARLGKFDEALACYESALGIDSGYRGAWVNKGFVLTKLGRFDEAASCADRALRLEAVRRAEPT